MILVDTSIWADHIHSPIRYLLDAIAEVGIVQHPFVTGELALGNPLDRRRMVTMLDMLPGAPVIEHGALIAFVETHAIGGTGLGLVDAHLLASARVANHRLWTRDKRLAAQAERLGLLHVD